MTTKEKLSESSDLVVRIESPRQGAAEGARDQVAEALASRPAMRSEVLSSAELTDEKIDEITDFFRLIFNNDWPELAVCTDCDSKLPQGMRKSAKEVFGAEEHVPLTQMDSMKEMPCCPECTKPMAIFHDPQKTRANLAEKLSNDGYVSLLRSGEHDKIAGFVFGYGTTLEREFSLEWANAYEYMAKQDPKYDRSLDELVKKLGEHVPDRNLGPDSQVFAWNCVAIGPEARGMRHFATVMGNFFNSLPPEKRELSVVGEVLRKSPAHSIFRKLGGIDVPGYLEGDDTIIVGHVGTITDRINMMMTNKKK